MTTFTSFMMTAECARTFWFLMYLRVLYYMYAPVGSNDTFTSVLFRNLYRRKRLIKSFKQITFPFVKKKDVLKYQDA